MPVNDEKLTASAKSRARGTHHGTQEWGYRRCFFRGRRCERVVFLLKGGERAERRERGQGGGCRRLARVLGTSSRRAGTPVRQGADCSSQCRAQ